MCVFYNLMVYKKVFFILFYFISLFSFFNLYFQFLVLLLLPSCLALNTREPVPPPVTSRNNPTEQWLNVRVNHFDASNTDTFPMVSQSD